MNYCVIIIHSQYGITNTSYMIVICIAAINIQTYYYRHTHYVYHHTMDFKLYSHMWKWIEYNIYSHQLIGTNSASMCTAAAKVEDAACNDRQLQPPNKYGKSIDTYLHQLKQHKD